MDQPDTFTIPLSGSEAILSLVQVSLHPIGFQSFDDECNETQRAQFGSSLDEHPDIDTTTTSLVPKFAGSLSARIGVLLDYSMVSAAEEYSKTSHQMLNQENKIPWQIRGFGFDASNVLVWTYNFMPFTTLQESCPTGLSRDGSHRTLVEASHTKIVLLCGPRAEQAIRGEFQNLTKSEIQLRYNFTIYFDNDYPRLFIRCPELPSRPSAVPYHHNSMIGEAVRFAAKMTGVEGLRTAFLETSTVIQYILCQIKAERLGKAKPMATDTTPEGLEKLSGTLSRGLLVVLHGRAKLVREGKIRSNWFWRDLRLKRGKQEVRAYERFDPEMYALARAFHSELAALSDKDLPATIDPAIIASITNGDNYPLADMFKAENQRKTVSDKPRCSGVSKWTEETERYKVTPYTYKLPRSTQYKHRRISVGHC
ncbi:hypothetical protein FAGAP_13110 [Fusarium agapanthi]|uniref:Uncharacterized protein n=1 Tax=Fusarium agapanthi TaxID=1803897 RepID=A0A9P5E2G8_9HYPO|nr:hypothetical protein FAGAP_13110 [Fusarium agapanthi]